MRWLALGAAVVTSFPVHAAAPPPPQAPESVVLHIEVRGRATVGLYRLADDPKGNEPALVCTAPCDVPVPAADGASFVLDGPRLSRSLSLSLAGQPDRAVLSVRPGFRALTIVGWVAVAVGVGAVVAGATTLTLADDDRRLRRAGGITLGAGLPVLLGGAITASFGRTRFQFGARRGARHSMQSRAAARR